MTNSAIIRAALDQHITHPLLKGHPSQAFLVWLARPCQLPIPFPSLGTQPLTHHLDLMLADWKHYQKSLTECCT